MPNVGSFSLPVVCCGSMVQGAVSAGTELCGGDELAVSIADALDALTDGDESAAICDRNVGELMLRPL